MTTRKIRGGARLKNLPRVRQDEIMDYAVTHTNVETANWLCAQGVQTSRNSVSEFLIWRRLQSEFDHDEATVKALVTQLQAQVPGITDEQLDELGSRTFSLLAIRRQDAKTFVLVRSARAKAQVEREKLALLEKASVREDERLKLAREKYEFDAAEMCLAKLPELKVISTDKQLTTVEKINQIRLRLFGEIVPQ